MNGTTRRNFLAGAVPLAVAAAGSAPGVTELRLDEVGGTTASLSWRTDSPSETQFEYEPVLNYGDLKNGDWDTIVRGPELVYHNSRNDLAPKTRHQVRLDGLRPGTGYYVRVRSASGGRVGPWTTYLFSTRVDVPPLPASGFPLKDFLVGKADNFAAAQRAERARIRTAADLRAYQKRIRSAFLEELGGLPERTPLKARVIRTIDRGDFRIENIIFESLPGLMVPGNLYVPAKPRERCPAILGLCGHERQGKSHPQHNQMTNVNLVRKGYVILQIDPPGQNELGSWDGDPSQDKDYNIHFNRFGNAHSLMHFNATLLGQSITRYFLWNGMRAIDYLCSRPEVDAERIGARGSSGGASQTMYISAIDERVKVAIPIHVMADTVAIMHGPFRNHPGHGVRPGNSTLDEESHPHNLLSRGLSFTSVLSLIAPRTLVIVAGTKDLQPLWTTQMIYEDLRGVWDSVSAADKLCFGVTDGYHSTHSIRQFSYWAFNRAFGKEDTGLVETHQDVLPSSGDRATRERRPTPLNVCPTGSVVRDFGSVTIFTKLRDAGAALHSTRPTPQSCGGWDGYRAMIVKRVREMLAVPERLPRAAVREGARSDRGPAAVQALTYEMDAGVPLAAELWTPRNGEARRGLLYLRQDPAKGADEIERFVAAGFAVLAPKVRGTREDVPDEPGVAFGLSNPHERRNHEALAIGRPLFGQRLLDVLGALEILRSRTGNPGVVLVGDGPGGLLALYAAVLDPGVAAVAMRGALSRYARVVETPYPAWIQNDRLDTVIVPGVLKHFDLPDVAALVAPRPLRIVGAVDGENRTLTEADARSDYARAVERYRDLGQSGRLVLTDSGDLTGWVGL